MAGTNGRAVIYQGKDKADADAAFMRAFQGPGVLAWNTDGTCQVQASIA